MPFFTYYAPGLEKGRRDYNLGPGYLIRDIRQRIASGMEFHKENWMDPAETSPWLVGKIPSGMMMSNLWQRSSGQYQKSYVLRVVWAVFYHGDPSGIPDYFSVRKDLLQINKLQEECACLMEYGISEGTPADKVLEQLKAEEQELRRDPGDAGSVRLAKIRHDKRILKRILKREQEDGLRSTQLDSEVLHLPEPVRKILEQRNVTPPLYPGRDVRAETKKVSPVPAGPVTRKEKTDGVKGLKGTYGKSIS